MTSRARQAPSRRARLGVARLPAHRTHGAGAVRGLAFVALSLLSGCSLEPLAIEHSGAGGDGGEGAMGGSAPSDCAPGELVGPDGECMAVGIQGCAERFMEDDGLCHPRLDKCPAGTIPKLDQGCVPVGIQGCAERFMEDDGLCHPRMDKCPADSFVAPLLGCLPIDGPDGCGTGTWGSIVDGPDTMWVDPVYAGGDGVGTQAQPFTTIADALAAVPAGGRVALAAGSYGQPVYIQKPVELVGRCPSLVTLSGIQPTIYYTAGLGEQEFDVIVLVEATGGVAIRNVGISGAGYGVIAVSATVVLQGVHIHEATAGGVFARDGADVTVDRSLIEHTQAPPVTPRAGGTALMASSNARLTVSHSALYRNRNAGVWTVKGSLFAEGMLVEGTIADLGSGTVGHGLSISPGSQVEVSSSALVDCCGSAASVSEAELELIDSVVDQTRPCTADGDGAGVVLRTHGWARLSGCAIVDNLGAGIFESDATVEARGNLVRGNAGPGMLAIGGRVAFVDNAVVRNEWAGVACAETDPGLLVERNLIEANGSADAEAYLEAADGVVVYYTPDALLRNNAAVDNYGTGIFVQRASAFVEYNLVEGTRATDLFYARTGEGVAVSGAAGVVEIDGLAALRNTTRGLWQVDAEQLTVRRAFIAGTGPRPADGELGCGAVVEGGGVALLERVIITDSQLAAMFVHGSDLTLRSSRLADTREGSFTGLVCPVKPCPWNQVSVHHGIADGLIAASAVVQISDLQVAGCSRAGILSHASSGSLAQVISTDNGFGLVLQGSPLPAVDDSCVFDPNHEQDVLTDSELAIPDGSSELPETPTP